MHSLGDPGIKESKIDLILDKKLIGMKRIVIIETRQEQQEPKRSVVDIFLQSPLKLIRTLFLIFCYLKKTKKQSFSAAHVGLEPTG